MSQPRLFEPLYGAIQKLDDLVTSWKRKYQAADSLWEARQLRREILTELREIELDLTLDIEDE